MSESRPKPRVFRNSEPAIQRAAQPVDLETDPTIDLEEPTLVPTRKYGRKSRIVGIALAAFLSLLVGAFIYDQILSLYQTNIWLGWAGLFLAAILIGALLLYILREIATLSRMKKVDGIRERAAQAWESLDRKDADKTKRDVITLYKNRPEFDAARREIDDRSGDAPDAETLLILLETEALRALDDRAADVARRAAAQVAAATALLPSGLLDAAFVLYINVRMLREVAEIYGGRAGWLGSWRLLKQVAFHLAATGAIALGDDIVGAVLGGGMLAKLSRRAGEGVLNGVLTARIGVAAMEVSRPMPFKALAKPSARGIATSALTSFIRKSQQPDR